MFTWPAWYCTGPGGVLVATWAALAVVAVLAVLAAGGCRVALPPAVRRGLRISFFALFTAGSVAIAANPLLAIGPLHSGGAWCSARR